MRLTVVVVPCLLLSLLLLLLVVMLAQHGQLMLKHGNTLPEPAIFLLQHQKLRSLPTVNFCAWVTR